MLHRLLPALLLALSTPAFAQPAEDEALKKRITTLYNQGNIAAQNNNWQAAHKAFLEAWNLKQHVQIAANLARAEFKLSLFRDAAEHLDFVLKNAPADTPPEEQKLARDMFDQARQHIGELKVEVNLEGAEVLINGNSIGYAPLKQSIFVEPGTHIVEARLDGYEGARVSKEVKPGTATQTISFRLLKKESESAKMLGPEGAKPTNEIMKPVFYTGLGLTGAGMILTGVFSGMAISYRLEHSKRYDEFPRCVHEKDVPTCLGELDDVAEKWASNANVALGAGVATGIVGASVLAYWFIAGGHSDSPKSPKVGLHFGPSGGSASVTVPW